MVNFANTYAKIGAGLLFSIALTACSGEKSDTSAATDNKGSEGTLVIATEANYMPFNGTTADGKIIGFDVDVINAVCEEMQTKCEVVAQDWDGLLPGLLTKKYDAVIAGMSITPERLEQVDFSDPYFANTIVWLAKNDGSFDPKDIKNMVLGGQRGTTGALYIGKNYDGKDGNRVQLYDTYENAYLDMKAGRNQAVMAEKASAAYWLKQNPQGFGLIGDEIDNGDNLGIAVRKGDTLKDKINKALGALKTNGKLEQIKQQHFSANAQAQAPEQDSTATKTDEKPQEAAK